MTEWIRHGECNQCGDCCRQATNSLSLLVPIADEAYGRVRYGAPVAPSPGHDGPLLFHIRGPLLMPCPQLDGDRCAIHETKPQYCIDNPSSPEDVEGTRCSYWFEDRETGELRVNPRQEGL